MTDSCPSDDLLIGFKRRSLQEEARSSVQSHLKSCRVCQKKLTTLVLSGIREVNEGNQADSDQDTPPNGSDPITMIAPGGASAKPPAVPKLKKSVAAASSSKGDNSKPPEDYPFLDPPEEPGEMARLGMYNILRVLGSGGMGVVFDAIDRRLNRRVALKVLRPELADESYVARFVQEARLAASLSDEYIVTLFEVGMSANVPFISMEYLHGEPLDGRLSRDGWLPIEEALQILKQAAQGLSTAHKAGLVHRDIKPANLWLESNLETGQFKRVKVLDFGLAKEVAKDSSLTAAGMIVGTPSYMAPEQVYGLPCDQRTDLFSMGCVLYRMVTGKLPFAGEDTVAVLQNTVDAPMPDLEIAGKTIPKKVLELLRRLLAKNPDDRPENAGLLVRQIDALLAGTAMPSNSSPSTAGSFGSASPTKKGGFPWVAWLSGVAALLAVSASVLSFFLVPPKLPPTGNPEKGGAAVGSLDPSNPTDPGSAVPVFTGEPIKVGVLFSKTGAFSLMEEPLAEVVRLAVAELNTAQPGKPPGVGGHEVKTVTADGASSPTIFASEALRLVRDEGCRVIFGCWTSSSRKAVLEVLEKEAIAGRDCLLFYPMQFEGLEESTQAVYLGMVPNQQVERALNFARRDLLQQVKDRPRKLFLVGSDYIYPRATFAVLKLYLDTRFAGLFEVVGEEYVPLKNPNLSQDVAAKIAAIKPDLVINALNGLRVNESFFHDLRRLGELPEKLPVINFSLSERDLEKMEDPSVLAGDYMVWSYFSALPGPENQAFLTLCRDTMKPATMAYDPLEATYFGVKLWAGAMALVGDASGTGMKIRQALDKHEVIAPQGRLELEFPPGAPKSLYSPHKVRFGKILKNRKVQMMDTNSTEIHPDPFPGIERPDDISASERTKAREQWQLYLESVRKAYDGQWDNSRREPVVIPFKPWWKAPTGAP